MYRAVTLFAMRNGLFDADGNVQEERLKELMPQINISFRLNEATHRPDTYLNGECVETDIRTLEVSSRVSKVAALPFVREKLVEQQQLMGREKGIVMDGRDIGTVVFPDAELKIFVTASAEIRAQRRYKELLDKGMPADYADILKNVQDGIRILGNGVLTKKLTVRANGFTKSAEEKITAAGGKVEVI